jgi:hypothetical protein
MFHRCVELEKNVDNRIVPKNETISTEMLAACTPTKFRV